MDEWADTQIDVDGVKGCIAAVTAQKQRQNANHVKILVSIGGAGKGSEHFATVASDPNLRIRFAHSVRDFVDSYGFDGADSKRFHKYPKTHIY
jgi:chitinase